MSFQYSGLMHKFMDDIKKDIENIFHKIEQIDKRAKRNTHNIEVNHQNIDRINKILTGKLSVPDFNDDYEESLEDQG